MNIMLFDRRFLICRRSSRLLVLLTGLFLFTASPAQQIDEVVLIVDDIAVTAREYSVLHFIQTQADSFKPVMPELGSIATETIVDELLLTGHARRLDPDVKISDAEVNEAIQALASRNQLSGDQLLAQLQSQGIDTQIFKSSLRQRLMVQQVIGQRIARSLNVSPIEVSEYIKNRPELRSQAQKNFRASHIVISIAEGLNKNEVKALRELAENIRARLQGGEKFSAVAAEYEVASASGNKGDLGWKKQEELPELFINALDVLKVGQVSPVLESSNGFHLLALTDVKSASGAPQEYSVRHIAKALPPEADERQLAAQLQNMKLQILAGLDFSAIAKAQSDDTGSAANGGDLGWIQLQQIDPAFAQVIQTLEPGQISDPVRTQFGVHLIQVMQVRAVPGAVTLESQVQQRIFSEKLDERMEDLLNDLKQVSLVEVVR